MKEKYSGDRTRRSVLRLTGVSLAGLAAGRVAASGPIEVGSAVVTARTVSVRKRPRPVSKVVATLEPGVDGEVVNGPVDRDGATWWGVRFDRESGPTWAWCTADALAVDGGDSGGGTGDGSKQCSTTVTTEFTGHLSGWDDGRSTTTDRRRSTRAR